MSTAMLAREILETLSVMEKRNMLTNRKLLLKGEDLFLVVLDEMGGMSTPSQLSEYTDFTPARLSAIIKALEGKGYILRQQNEIDKRSAIIEITEKGSSYSKELKEATIKNSLGIIEKLGEKDSFEFVRLLKKLFDVMENEERRGE
ncbi:MAG: winged helix DNA-binding protein [Clostridia bacterium]|nr:winged helix DNA-binding protein [Clostridia bacterium]